MKTSRTTTMLGWTLAVTTVSAAHVAAQTHRVELGVGGAHLAYQDLIHSPFVHGGTSPLSVGLRYERSGRTVHFGSVGYATFSSRVGDASPIVHGDYRHDALPHGYHFVELTYGIGRSLGTPQTTRSVIGSAIRTEAQAADYHFGFESNFGYFISTSLDVWYARELVARGRHRATGRLSAPLVSWVARSPYMVNDDRFIENIESGDPTRILLAFLADGELVGWRQLQRVDAALDHRLRLSARWEVGAVARLAVLRHSSPLRLTSSQSSLHATTSIRF